MTFERWVAVLSLATNVGLLVIFALQLRSLVREVAQAAEATKFDHKRRREQATIEFYASTQGKRFELRQSLPDDRDGEAIARVLQRARYSRSLTMKISQYLGFFELLATGVNAGVLDRRVMNNLAGPSIIKMVEYYKPWMRERRRRLNDFGLYCELADLAAELRRRCNLPPEDDPLEGCEAASGSDLGER